MGLLGIAAGLALLIALAYRGWSILLLAPLAALLAATFSRDVIRHSFDPEKTRAAILALAREAIARDATYVIQTELPELTLAELPGTPAAL